MANEDRLADAFFRKCLEDGRMSPEEFRSVAVKHYSAGTRPEWVKLSDYYAGWCRTHLVYRDDLEIFLNEGPWTHAEIAAQKGISQDQVRRALNRVYKVMPELQRFRGNGHSIPKLSEMLSVEVSDINGNSPADQDGVRERY